MAAQKAGLRPGDVLLEIDGEDLTGKTTQQVSDLLNFPNQSFFGVYFKKEVGCSPRAYQDSE